VIAEYDGDIHRTSTRQYERDIGRFDAAAELGWRVVRVRKRGVLVAPEDTVRRVTRALT
jgi:very-short-patch-repair endonuclease